MREEQAGDRVRKRIPWVDAGLVGLSGEQAARA